MGGAGSEPTFRFLGARLADQYELLEVIGEGGMGVVFRARQVAVNRDVAVKVLHRRLASDERAVKRFENEAKIISQLRHPNTLRLYDCMRTPEGDLFIVTELLSGTPLSQVIAAKGRLESDRAARIIHAVAGSLSEAHAAGIVHRDLKPENIFIDRVGSDDVVKVLDFGIAKITESVDGLTLPGRINGTPPYMAPEQIRGEKIDERTDIYALGVLFYQMLAGFPPFTGSSVLAILDKHLNEQPRSLQEIDPKIDVSGALDALVLRMLEKERAKRPDSVEALRRELASLTASEPMTSVPSSPPEPAFDEDARTVKAMHPELAAWRPAAPSGRRPPFYLGAALVGVGAVIALAYAFRAPTSVDPAPASPQAGASLQDAASSASPVATVFVSTDPQGSVVEVNGMVKADSTPAVLKLPPGHVTMQLAKGGFETLVFELDLTAEHEEIVDRRLAPVRRVIAPEIDAEVERAPEIQATHKPSRKVRRKGARAQGSLKPNPFD